MRALIFAALLPLPAFAGNFVSMIVADVDGDGKEDVAILSGTETYADLTIRSTLGGEVTAPAFAWMGVAAGTLPGLERSTEGSLLVHSMNEAIGRNRWHQTLTIAYRDGAYRVAGFTYSWYDTLDLAASGSCDLNLLTGKGVLTIGPDGNETPIDIYSLTALEITVWQDIHPPECRPE